MPTPNEEVAVQTMNTPPSEHLVFDELCAGLADWEPILAVPFAAPPELEPEGDDEDRDAGPIDDLILAGLVSPY